MPRAVVMDVGAVRCTAAPAGVAKPERTGAFPSATAIGEEL
ncbi:hypothetical protein QMZ92_31615 [Streptomyces sp. HNM0645]|nr:hypothetical protein [Streptomyces sp. HNM0645]MDI9888776.1 hypothetical protein [Streptomyces sp. HNM0645]